MAAENAKDVLRACEQMVFIDGQVPDEIDVLHDWWPKEIDASQVELVRQTLGKRLTEFHPEEVSIGAAAVALVQLLAEIIASMDQQNYPIAILNLIPSLRAEVERRLLSDDWIFVTPEWSGRSDRTN